MVAPKHKAIQYENRDAVVNAYNELDKIRANVKDVEFLIKLFNDFHNNEMLTLRSFSSCGDCRTALKNFFRYVIEEWKKTS
jgi:hypothetical protein